VRGDGCVSGLGPKLVSGYQKDECGVYMICPLLLFQTPVHEQDVFLVLQQSQKRTKEKIWPCLSAVSKYC
jgi:hypothetical protein